MKKTVVFILAALLALSASAFAQDAVGTSSGTFTNPVYETDGAPFGDGVGTSSFAWGSSDRYWSGGLFFGHYVYIKGDDQSQVSFTGGPFSTDFEEEFTVGTLSYYNGTIYSGTGATAIDLDIVMDFTTPSGINESFVYNMQLINTPNSDWDPVGSADYVKLPSSFAPAYFTVDGTDYTLELTGFYESDNGGYTQIDEFHIYEGNDASAELRGKITADFPPAPNPVPEASTVALAASGLGMVGFVLRRRK